VTLHSPPSPVSGPIQFLKCFGMLQILPELIFQSVPAVATLARRMSDGDDWKNITPMGIESKQGCWRKIVHFLWVIEHQHINFLSMRHVR